MKLKNLSPTIISIGKTVILPDETVEVSDLAYANNAAIVYLVKTKRLAITADDEKKEKKASSSKKSTSSTQSETGTTTE